MISKDKIARINELAAKAKSATGLTKDETIERESLRREYIDSVKNSVRSKLKNVHFVEDLSEEELRKYKSEGN